MGLPGSGKTTLAKRIVKILGADWLNADKVRGKYQDWDFSNQGIIRQVKRMKKLSLESKKKIIIADFVCPIQVQFKIFNPDFIIWMDTIKKSRFKSMNRIFKRPKNFHLKVTTKNVEFWLPKVIEKMISEKIINEYYSKFIEKKLNSAIILCGGRGTRLGSVGKKLPKTLVKIHNKPILWYIIKSLLKNSINHFILPLGYKGEQIAKYINTSPEFKNLNIDLVKTGQNTSISRRIFKVKNMIKSKNLALLNGDAIFDFNLKEILKKHHINNTDVTFLGCSAPLAYGVVGIQNGKITTFQRDLEFNYVKSYKRNNFSGHIFSGISIIKSNLIMRNFKKSLNFEKEFYPKIIKKNNTKFRDINGFWYSIDNEKDIKNLNTKLNNLNYLKIKKIKKKFIN